MPATQTLWFPSPLEAQTWLASRLAERAVADRIPDPPALVVVPSRSVREGLAQALLWHRPAWLGVEVRTLQGTAYSVLQRGGVLFRPREALLPVVVSRVTQNLAARYEVLRLLTSVRSVGPLLATVRDLLDAGFTASHLDAALELAAAELEEGLGGKAEAVLQVAASVQRALEEAGVFRRNDALTLATHLLRTQGLVVWPPRPLVIYGFADVTGVAGDFLEALLSVAGGEVILVQPPDPVDGAAAAGEGFLQRLQQRLGVRAPEKPGRSPLPRLSLWEAPEREAEVRWVAEDIRTRLAQGVPPERLAVVARALAPYALAIRRHFAALGVPFSAYQPAPVAQPRLLRLKAVLAVAEAGSAASVAQLLSVLPRGAERPWSSAVARLIGATGARTVGQLVARGLALLQEEKALRLEPAVCQELRCWLEALAKALEGEVPEGTAEPLASRLETLAALCGVGGDERVALMEAAEAVRTEANGFSLSRQEWCFLLEEVLRERLSVPLGGQGGGVAVLSAMEARFRTFDHLYLVGLLRDVFPRVPKEDPLLPDSVRRRLSVVLPDIPLAERARSEERYLFGLLLASAPSAWLSWPACDPDGRPIARSPLVDELEVAHPPVRPQRVPGRETLVWEGTLRPAPPEEWAVFAGFAGDRKGWLGALTLALEHATRAWPSMPGPAPRRVARGRDRVLREWSPPPWEARGHAPSPYLGFLGSAPWVDQVKTLAAVTTMESYAECPWRTFLGRVLGLENRYAAEQEATDTTARLLGEVVHGVLEVILAGHAAERKRRRREGGEAAPFRWPGPRELEATLHRVTEASLRRLGAVYPGLALALEAAAKPYLEVARQLLTDPPLDIFSGEGEGWMGSGPDVPFWHFRFDAAAYVEGNTVLFDFKTGNPQVYLEGKTDLVAKVRRGQLLQGALYAAASRSAGCYVFLRPDWDGDRLFPIGFSETLRRAVVQTFQRFFAAARLGVFFPRLVEPTKRVEPDPCERCSVRLACARGDSGARRRLEAWGDRVPERNPAVEAAWRHWWLAKET